MESVKRRNVREPIIRLRAEVASIMSALSNLACYIHALIFLALEQFGELFILPLAAPARQREPGRRGPAGRRPRRGPRPARCQTGPQAERLPRTRCAATAHAAAPPGRRGGITASWSS